MQGIRKLFLAVLFGTFAFVAFFFTPKDVSFYTALVGVLIGLAGWYHQANIQEHKINGGDRNGKQ